MAKGDLMRHACSLVVAIAGCAMMATVHAAELRPAATTSFGPWEIVVWVSGTRVQQCTLVRAAPAAGEPKFGILIDSQGGVLSVDTPAWRLSPKLPVAATLAPSAGSARRMTVEPVSTSRANIRFAPESPLLEELQRSDFFRAARGRRERARERRRLQRRPCRARYLRGENRHQMAGRGLDWINID
jgi:hypothetical protein